MQADKESTAAMAAGNRRGLFALGVFAALTLTGVFFAAELYFGFFGSELDKPFSYYLIWTLSTAWSWLAVFPILLACARRWPFTAERWGRSLAGHALCFLVVSPLQVTLDILLTTTGYALDRGTHLLALLSLSDQMYASGLAGAPVPFALLTGLIHGIGYYRKYRERELDASRLGNALALARLQQLRSQVNPHFLFNTLNAIGALSRRDPEATNRMITLLCALLRRSLDSQTRQMVPLGEEVAFAMDYLEIERVRFSDRLKTVFDVPDDLLDVEVPSLILQPLVENAVRHGIAPRSAPGLVTVSARRTETSLNLVVEDDGAGLQPARGNSDGLGLRLTRERLELLYRGAARFDVSVRAGGGTIATVTLPLPAGGHEPHGEPTR
ncbi:MAG: sensor histidine kinase [Acidobacteriota bacterium]